MIPGREDDPLVPGEELLSLPGFWAAYLLWLAEGEDYEPEPSSFGVDAADVDAAFERLTDPANWPVFRVPLAHGHCISIVQRNFTEDEGVDYYLTHPEWHRAAQLASLEGHYSGPGLAWRELIHIAEHPGDGHGVIDTPSRLLLLLPILGDNAIPAYATSRVASALAAVGVPDRAGTELAENLLDHPFWEGETWSPQRVGFGEAAGDGRPVLICASRHSPRAVPFGISTTQQSLLTEALGSLD